MESFEIAVSPGDGLHDIMKIAKSLAKKRKQNIKFVFNRIICIVSAKTSLQFLSRDYYHALQLNLDTAGPDCKKKVKPEIKKQIEELRKKNEHKQWLRDNAPKIKEERDKLLMGLKEAKDIIITSGIYKEDSIGLLGINDLIKEMDVEK